jgi:glutathione synthase
VKFLFVMDPIEGIDITKDTTFVFLAEAQARGHESFYCGITDLYARGGRLFARACPLEVHHVQGAHWKFGARVDLDAESFECIFMRKDPPFDSDFYFSTQLLSLVDDRKVFMFNRPAALREASEKMFIMRYPELIAETMVSADAARILAFAHEVGGDIVVKPLDGCGGAGIFRVREGDLNNRSILETLTEEGRHQIMAQRFLPESRVGDMRLIVIDGEPAGAMKRVPRDDDLRGNIHVGGRCVAADIGAREKEIVDALKPSLAELGIYFAGLDIIGDCLTEVNVTSPTGVQEVNALSGLKLESDVIDMVERKVAELPDR